MTKLDTERWEVITQRQFRLRGLPYTGTVAIIKERKRGYFGIYSEDTNGTVQYLGSRNKTAEEAKAEVEQIFASEPKAWYLEGEWN